MAEWRNHPRYTGYQVSDDGRVRSVDRVVPNRWGTFTRQHGRELSTFRRKGGYLGGNLGFQGSRLNFEVHVLVAEAWHGPRPDGMQARHINGDQTDNRPANVAWATVSVNAMDKVRHGTHHEASKTHCPQGHEYTEANTYRPPGKPRARHCRACMRAREAARPPRSHRGISRGRSESAGR